MTQDNIIYAKDLEFLGTRPLPPYVEYEEGYSSDNLPRLYRVSDYRSNHFSGVRSCSSLARADASAKNELVAYRNICIRYNPNLKVVRSSWEGGWHYWNNRGGGGSPRKCNGHATATFYVDFELTKELEEYLLSPKSE